MAVEDFVARIVMDAKNFIKGSKKATDAAERYRDEMERLGDVNNRFVRESTRAGRTASSVGSSFSRLGSAVIVLNQGTELLAKTYRGLNLAVSGVIKPFAAYEKALVGVGKTTNIAGVELQTFGNQIKTMSERIPVATDELLGIAQAAGQLGVTGTANLINFSETIAKLGVASDLAGEEAAVALTRMLNITGASIDQIDELGSAVVSLGNNFAATESEITRVGSEIAKASGVFGVSADQALALGAAMKSVGIQAELGGSVVGKSFRTIELAISKGGSSLEDFAALTGMTAVELRKTFKDDAVVVFQRFVEGLDKVGKAGGSVSQELEKLGLKGDEINKVLPVLAQRSDLVAKALTLSSKEMKNATALNNEAAKAFNTLSSNMQKTSNTFTNLATDIGKSLAPAFSDLLASMRDLVPVIRSVFNTILSIDFKGLAKEISATAEVIAGALVTAILILNPGLITAAASATIIAAKFLAIVAVIGAIVVAIDLVIKNINKVGKVFTIVIDSIRLMWVKLNREMVTIFTRMLKGVTGGVARLVSLFDKDLAASIKGFEGTIDVLDDKFKESADAFGAELNKSIEEAKTGLGEFDLGILGKVIDEGTKALDKFNDGLKDTKKLADGISVPGAEQPKAQPGQPPPGSGIQGITPTLFDDTSLGVMKDAFGGAFAEGASTFSSAMGSAVLGPLGAAQAVIGAGQALVDLIPGVLNAASGLLNSLTELPLVIADALIGLLSSIGNLIANLIPNIIKGFTNILSGVADFLAVGLPQAMADLPILLLDALLGLIDKLPAIITGIIVGGIKFFLVSLPKLVIALVKMIPVIVKALAKAVPIIIKELSKALGELFQELAQSFFGLLDGGLDKVRKQAQKSFKALADSLTGATSQLFEVIEGTVKTGPTEKRDPERKGVSVKQMTAAVDKVRGIFSQGMVQLREAWLWVWDNVLKPITDLVKKAWLWVWNKVLLPIVGLVKKAFQWVIDKILTPLANVVMQAFQWVVDKIIDPLAGVVEQAFQWVVDNILSPLGRFVKDAWQFVLDFFATLGDIVKNAWQFVVDLFQGLADLVIAAFAIVGQIFDTLKGIVEDAFGFVEDIFNGLIGIVEKAFGFVVDIFDGLAGIVEDAFGFVQKIFNGLKGIVGKAFEGVKNIFKGMSDAIDFGAISDKFKNIFKKLGDFLNFDGIAKKLTGVFDGLSLNGLKDSFTKMFKKLDPSNMLSKMFKFDGGGKGTVEKLLNIDVPFVSFAEGGIVPGSAKVAGDSLANDNVLAFLSPGELVIPRSITQDETMMTAMMTAMSQAGQIPQFGLGGFVKAIVKGDLNKAKSEAAGTVRPPTSIKGATEQLKEGAKDLGGIFESVFDALKANTDKIREKMVDGLRSMISGTSSREGVGQGGIVPAAISSVAAEVPQGFDPEVVKFLSAFKDLEFFNQGGAVVGSDTVPALLTPGEFIVSAGSAGSIGIDALRDMNRTGTLGGGSGNTNIVEFQSGAFQISVTADQFDEGFVRGTMMDVIKEELREATTGGENIISEAGVF